MASVIDIVYPVKKSKWELEILYSLRSLDMYFKTPFCVHICGDYRPEWLVNVEYRQFDRNPEFCTEKNIAPILEWACRSFSEFIWVNDDVYFLKDTNTEDLRPYCHVGNLSEHKNRGHRRWQKLLWETYDALSSCGVAPVLNYSTHMPIHYKSDELLSCASDFPIFFGQMLHETVYHNIFRAGTQEKLTCKAGFYDRIKQNFDGLKGGKYRVLNHDDNGLTDGLKTEIADLFSKKSKFER